MIRTFLGWSDDKVQAVLSWTYGILAYLVLGLTVLMIIFFVTQANANAPSGNWRVAAPLTAGSTQFIRSFCTSAEVATEVTIAFTGSNKEGVAAFTAARANRDCFTLPEQRTSVLVENLGRYQMFGPDGQARSYIMWSADMDGRLVYAPFRER